MALRLAPKGSGGTCCECAEFTGCDCGELTATLQCRTRGGTATLCGFNEFSSPSSPPKKYRKNTIDENFSWCTWGDSSCSGEAARFQLIMDGVASYNVSTCALTQVSLETRNDVGECAVPSSSFSTEPRSRMVYDPAFMVLDTDTATSRAVSARPACYNFSGTNHVTATGSGSETLSEEDTEDDAIDRVVAEFGWSEWAAVGALCENPECCGARYEERVSGFSFVYVEAEYRVRREGMTPGTSYDIEVDIYRRAYGSGEYELFATVSLSATVDGFGILETAGQAVPNEAGYETYAASPARLTVAP